MDNQSIEQCKYLLLARCLGLQSHLDRTIEDQTHDEQAVRYADRLLERTPREVFSWREFEKIQKYLDYYCFAILIGNFEWARESIRGIETLASEPAECSCLF